MKTAVRTIAVVLLGVVLGLGAALAVGAPDFLRSAVRHKIDGELPELTWYHLATGAFVASFQPPWMLWTEGEDVAPGPCSTRFETPFGPFWGRTGDDLIIDFLLKEQTIHSVYDWGPVGVEPGDVVFDVGAHLGTFVRLALRAGAARVIGFEPEPVNIACLKKTFADEIASGKFVLIEAAAWDGPGTLEFTVPHNAAGRVTSEGELTVDAVAMDAVAEELELERVDFIKMDIEGAERTALLGARRILDEFAPKLALCTYHRSDDAVVIPEVVESLQDRYAKIERSQQVYFYLP